MLHPNFHAFPSIWIPISSNRLSKYLSQFILAIPPLVSTKSIRSLGLFRPVGNTVVVSGWHVQVHYLSCCSGGAEWESIYNFSVFMRGFEHSLVNRFGLVRIIGCSILLSLSLSLSLSLVVSVPRQDVWFYCVAYFVLYIYIYTSRWEVVLYL